MPADSLWLKCHILSTSTIERNTLDSQMVKFYCRASCKILNRASPDKNVDIHTSIKTEIISNLMKESK